MIAASRSIAVVCAVCALGVHVAALGFAPNALPDVETEGAAGAPMARLGGAFEDMVAGALSADPARDVTQHLRADHVTDPAQTTHKPAAPPDPEPAKTPIGPPPVQSLPVGPLIDTKTAVARVTAQPPKPEAPVTHTAETVTQAAPSVSNAASVAVQTRTAPPTPDVLASVENDDPAPRVSSRPHLRSKAFETRNAPPVRTVQKKTNTTPARATGNAQKTAAKGSATGDETATAARQGAQGKSAENGNARASNYPGQVMQRLSRVSRPRVGSRGTAVVAFRVASNGGLSAASIARSSGSAHLDQAALSVVQKAAPFPKPPTGAQRDFRVNIKGR
ncbi:MAG: TonB family protein [Pseudomonadota bacterium]